MKDRILSNAPDGRMGDVGEHPSMVHGGHSGDAPFGAAHDAEKLLHRLFAGFDSKVAMRLWNGSALVLGLVAMTAGTFDAGYTLEPNASTMRKLGVATTIEAGVIAHYVLGDPNANAFVGGAALTSDFIKNRPDVAKRFAAAWGKAVALINDNPAEARKHLLKNTFTPDDVVDTVPMIRYFMAKDLTAKDKADYQKFIDFSVKNGTLEKSVNVNDYLAAF